MPGRAAYRPACSGGISDRDRDGLSRYRRCRPCAQQLDQKLLLFLGFGLRDPTHGLFGILPELMDSDIATLRDNAPSSPKPAPIEARPSEQNSSRASAMHSLGSSSARYASQLSRDAMSGGNGMTCPVIENTRIG